MIVLLLWRRSAPLGRVLQKDSARHIVKYLSRVHPSSHTYVHCQEGATKEGHRNLVVSLMNHHLRGRGGFDSILLIKGVVVAGNECRILLMNLAVHHIYCNGFSIRV
jgi:hypothetical protein